MTESNKKVVVLVGGVGGAKLAYGLAQIVSPENLTVIVNTGDDFWHYGLRICPDVDTITYTLAGLANKEFGWGLEGDTTITLSALKRLGEEPWFGLRDQDIATHLLRTQLWHKGHTLTAITNRISRSLGVACTILPMTDAPVATMIDTVEYGELPFQEYFVKYRWQPTIKAIRLDGIEAARPSDAAKEAITNANIILVGPSNPWLSINPILRVPGMKTLLLQRDVPRVAVTPLVQGQAIKGPTAKIMRELDLPNNMEAILENYDGILNGFVYDQRDAPPSGALRKVAFDTIMDDTAKRITLAQNVLNWINRWEKDYEHVGDYPR